MFVNKQNRKILASVLAVVYIFVALFSQNFHQHDSGVLFKDFNFKKSEKSFSESSFAPEYNDCLSCHFLHDGNALILEKTTFQFAVTCHGEELIFDRQKTYFHPAVIYFNRRGPPSNFS